eukprot:m.1928 g.1928  ORF g.1928 m.1928 type:complete len:2015 (+) comp8067_c0_seq1:84-6128(+)
MDAADDFSKLPTEEKVVHKLWKARSEGYEEASKLFRSQDSEKSPVFQTYVGLMKKFVIEPNALTQDKSVEAAFRFVENAAVAARVCSDVVGGIVTKCMNARTKTRSKGIEICLMFIEIEKSEQTVEELITGLRNKQPKIVIGCLETLTQAVQEFGVKVVKVKPVLKLLGGLFEHSDKGVREQTKLLVIEIYKFIREAILPSIQTIKPVQRKELEETWKELPPGRPLPSRFIRSEQGKQHSSEAAAAGGEVAEGAPSQEEGLVAEGNVDIDPLEFVEPVDILGKLPSDFYTNTASPAWKTRKEALDLLLPLAESPKLVDGHYGDLVKTLHRIILKDSNVMIVVVAAKCVAGLAKGLKKKFSAFTSNVMTAVLEKFKEKKQMVVTSLRDASDALFQTTSLDSILEVALPYLDHKNPNVKAETASLLSRSFAICASSHLPKAVLKQICPKLVARLDDTTLDVRNAAADALGVLLKVVGERPLSPYLDGLDKTKEAKVKEASSKAEVKFPASSSSRTSVASTASKQSAHLPASKSSTEATAQSKPKPIPKKTSAAKAVPAKPSSAAVKRPASGGTRGKGKDSGGFKEVPVASEPDLTTEEIREKAVEMLSSDLVSKLDNPNWKERLSACEEIRKCVEALEDADINAFVVVSILAGKKPGWKDSNFQVMRAKFSLVSHVASNAKVFGKRSIAVAIPGLVDKLADTKIKVEASECLSMMAEVTSLNYISMQACRHAAGHKSPKVHSESLVWLAESIKAFGFKINLKPHIDHIKSMLQATNPSVRSAAISTLGVIFLYVGNQLRVFFEEERPALLAQIDAEFSKMADEKPPKPHRGATVTEDEPADDESSANEVAVSISDLFPRVDVSGKLRGSWLKELTDKNWKVRGEALQKVSDILSEAKFILPSLGELPDCLKARLGDSNKNLVATTLNVMSAIATAMGPAVVKYIRAWGPGILNVLSDSKPQQRAVALACLNAFWKEVSIVPFIEAEVLSVALATENPHLRSDLLEWLGEKLGAAVARKMPTELNLIVPPFLSCLEDRSADVRKKAQAFLGTLVGHVGVKAIAKAADKLTPASKQNVMSLVEKWKHTAGSQQSEGKAKGKAETKPVESAAAAPVKPKSAATRKKTAAAAPVKKKASVDSDEDIGPPLLPSNKEKRFRDEETMKIFKWNFVGATSPRDECVDQLRDQLQSSTSQSLHSHLFHADFKHHLLALATMEEFISPDNRPVIVSSLDLILKWITLRFFDKNTTVLMKCLEFLDALFAFLSESDYVLHDMEANAFLPYLIMKVGDPKDVIRKQVRSLMRRACDIYPAPKVYVHTSEGVKSKNSRQRTECLEEMGCLIVRHTTSVCPPKGIAFIASSISDRDSAVRSAALNCLVEVYRFEGEKMYKLAGALSSKDVSLLEERVKRAAGSGTTLIGREESMAVANVEEKKKIVSGKKKTLQASATDVSVAPKVKIDWDLQGIPEDLMAGLPEIPDSLELKSQYEELMKLPEIELPARHPRVEEARAADPVKEMKSIEVLKKPQQSNELAQVLDFVISQISSHDIHISTQTLRTLQKLLKQKDNICHIVSHVDQLICSITLQIQIALSTHLSQETANQEPVLTLLRYIINATSQIIHVLPLARAMSRGVVRDLLRTLLNIILDDRVLLLKDSAQIHRNVNAIVLQIVANSDPTNCFGGLLQLLSEMSRSDGGSPKLLQLIMKCIWRLTKSLPKVFADLNISQVLFDCHSFLSRHPPSAWTVGQEDTPLRTVKTLLYTLAKTKKGKLLDHMDLIPNATESECYKYVVKTLQKLQELPAKFTSTGKEESHQQEEVESEVVSPVLVKGQDGGGAESPLQKRRRDKITPQSNRRLSEIFTKISSSENTIEGLDELHAFLQKHPEVDIKSFLERTSAFYQGYIRRGLEQRQESSEFHHQLDELEKESEENPPIEHFYESLKNFQARIDRLNETNENLGDKKKATPLPIPEPSSSTGEEDDGLFTLKSKPVLSAVKTESSTSESSSLALAALKERLVRFNARK